MKTPLIQRIQDGLNKEGLQARTRKSRDWLINKARNLRSARTQLLEDGVRFTPKEMLGKMYFFCYDPKTKDRMKYYDMFPLVIPIDFYDDGFLGLNLHYIDVRTRMRLLDKLSAQFSNNHRYNKNTQLKLTYDLLKASAKVYEATPCIKRYLYDSKHLKSQFLKIDANEWDIAATLPVEQFKKARKTTVWKDSAKKIKKLKTSNV